MKKVTVGELKHGAAEPEPEGAGGDWTGLE